jgi:hypothetical protein
MYVHNKSNEHVAIHTTVYNIKQENPKKPVEEFPPTLTMEEGVGIGVATIG